MEKDLPLLILEIILKEIIDKQCTLFNFSYTIPAHYYIGRLEYKFYYSISYDQPSDRLFSTIVDSRRTELKSQRDHEKGEEVFDFILPDKTIKILREFVFRKK